MTEDDLRPWEPWQPKHGDRVRVRLSPECPFCVRALRLKTNWHFDGMTGMVVSVKSTYIASNRLNGHIIGVEPEREWFQGTGIFGMALFAAIELELLADHEQTEART